MSARGPLLGVVLVGLLLTTLATWRQARHNGVKARHDFEALALGAVERLSTRFRGYEDGLREVRAVVGLIGGARTTRHLFRAYYESRDEFPGARGFGFIRRVSRDDEAAFLAEARREGADFHIKELGPSPGERYVIQMIEPIERNQAALGLDIGSEENRRLAADVALSTGEATITRPITLVQAVERRAQGFLLLLPVYEPGAPQGSPAERLAAGIGWIYAPLVLEEVLADIEGLGLDLELTLDDSEPSGAFSRFFGPPGAAPEGALVYVLQRPVFGRVWRIELRATPDFIEGLELLHPALVFGVGALISGLAAALLHLYLVGRRRRALILAGQAQIATIVENSSDAIITQGLDGRVTGWNQAAARIFGFSTEDALGRPFHELVPTLATSRTEESAGRSVRDGRAVQPFDQVCRRRDGSFVEVSVTITPITGADGAVVGVGRAIRDVGAHKAVERELQGLSAKLEGLVRERTAQLETARRDLQTILDALPSMIGYWDAKLTRRFANHAYQRWFGSSHASMSAWKLRDLLGDDFLTDNRPHTEAVLRGERQVFERALVQPDGSGVRQLLVHYLPDLHRGEVRGFYVLAHDITELTESRQQRAAAIREKEALLRTIQSHLLFSATDSDGRILDVNEVFCAVSGYSREELIGARHTLLSSGAHDASFWAEVWAKIRSGSAWHGEVCNRARDGSLFWVDTVIAPLFGEDGEIVKFVSTQADITASKVAARELARKRARLDNILRGTDAGTWEWNVQTGELRLNERWAAFIGHTLAELGPMRIEDLTARVHPDDLAEVRALLARHFAGELEFFRCEARFRHREGRWVWLLGSGRVSTWTESGAPEWMYGTFQDIDRAKESQRALAASEAFLERAGQLARVGGWAVDLESQQVTWTSETRRIYEADAGLVPTLPGMLEFYEPAARAEIAGAIERAEPFDLELPLVTAGGRRIWVRAIGEPEHSGRGERPVRLVGAVQDITARRASDDALREATRAAEAASAAKSQFLANMSHEIRTPLHAILGLSYLLERSELGEEQRRLVGAVRIAGKGLLGVVDDVLDLAKIEAGNFVLSVAPFDPRALLLELRDVFGEQAQAKGLTLTVEVPKELPPLVEGDAARVRQILTNLLGNAVKFTERGGVSLRAEVLGKDAERLAVRFTVRDTGVGIALEARERLFQPFAQADASTTRRFGGTGLGLSIVRHLAILMGGEVSVRADLDEGSEFCVVLPLGVPPAREGRGRRSGAVTEPTGPRLAGVRVLVVDDNEINLEVARQILLHDGAAVETRGDGRSALDLLREGPEAFDVVLMDVQMPGMDGNEATSRIRCELGLYELPVIALTAGALLAERKRALDAGMSDFVSKPLDPDTLVKLIRSHVGGAPGAGESLA